MFLWNKKARCCLIALTLPAFSLLSTGCASRGNPLPPSLHLPALATNLKAERVADEVRVSWTTPEKTSDGLLLHDDRIIAVLCRDLAQPARKKGAAALPCIPVSRRPVSPGESHAIDTLPPALTQDPPQLLVYRIELLNRKNRSAGISLPVLVPAGTAPGEPSALQLSATPAGALIRWTPDSRSSAVMELTRTLVADPRGPVSAAASDAIPKARSTPFSPAKTSSMGPVVLRAKQVSAEDSGGLIDPAALPHNIYTYTAQRVRTVTLDGHPYELRSASSPTATFTLKDVFPPRSPSGLESIASAPLTGPPSIDLSWEPSFESDVLGYNVYRSDAGEPFTRLNSKPLAAPSFRDMTATPNHLYRYRITAVDRTSNESSPSPTIEETLKIP